MEREDVLARIHERREFIEGVVITGGEPTVQPDLPEFIKELRGLGLKVKLDTNGVHPGMVEKLIAEKQVDFFAMDIKNTFPQYEKTVGAIPEKVKENCEKTMSLIARSGVPYEFRTTTDAGVHSVRDILTIAVMLPAHARYALQGIRRAKTRAELPPAAQDLATFLNECRIRILEARPDLHLIIRA